MLPDLTVMGKIIGGGLPAAAFGGSAALMERIAPGRRRLPGRHAEREPARGRRRAARRSRCSTSRPTCRSATPRARSPTGCARRRATARSRSPSTTGLLTVFFAAEPPTDYAGAAACDLEAYGAWCRALLARGVYPPASQFEAWFPSTAHTAEHIARTVEAAAAAFAEVVMSALERARRARCATEGGLLRRDRRRSDGAGAAAARRRRRRPRRGLPAAGRGDPRGLPAALRAGRVVQPDDPGPRAAGRRPALRARPRAARGDRRPRRGGRAGRRDRAVRAGARRGRPGARRGRLGRRARQPSPAVRPLTTRPRSAWRGA